MKFITTMYNAMHDVYTACQGNSFTRCGTVRSRITFFLEGVFAVQKPRHGVQAARWLGAAGGRNPSSEAVASRRISSGAKVAVTVAVEINAGHCLACCRDQGWPGVEEID